MQIDEQFKVFLVVDLDGKTEPTPLWINVNHILAISVHQDEKDPTKDLLLIQAVNGQKWLAIKR